MIHRLIRLQVGNHRLILWIILVSIGLNRLCSILPWDIYLNPFPLYELKISLQAYCFFITNHLAFIGIWYSQVLRRDRLSDIFQKFMIIEIASLLDFILIYEHPWFYLGSYGVEFTDAKILLYTYFILKWNNSGN